MCFAVFSLTTICYGYVFDIAVIRCLRSASEIILVKIDKLNVSFCCQEMNDYSKQLEEHLHISGKYCNSIGILPWNDGN